MIYANLIIADHQCRSNWVVVHFRYEIMLGMPWHRQDLPVVDYNSSVVNVSGLDLPFALKTTERFVFRA